ncbi:DUF3455 domain-containing protein [Streptomyces scabiei]|uniref:DUF3455 domain-containing protein n=1 Tax=Streptomyces TaxID=1883 RepID=UPI0029BA9CDB|nr:DUF3455 domain-containing protein [Streptomyces scabiei]MDX3117842.1 DUF3455 domain-containing protein [Streptomyces scabiei]
MLFSKRAALTAGSIVTAAASVIAAAAVSHASDRPATEAGTVARSHATPVAPQLRVPDGNKRIAELAAKGVQTYACTNDAWTFVEPAATLSDVRDRHHRPVALHSRGPVWVSTVDGSAVNAAAVPGASNPRAGAVPELLLKATADRGQGLFGSVSYIQRLNTRGGVAPTGPCEAGAQTGVPYTATYVFYEPTVR